MAIQKMHLDIEMADGTVHTDIVPNLADQMLYSKTRAQHKWAPMAEDPMLFINFLAFAALRRLGLFTSGGFEKFCDEAVAVGESGDFEGMDTVDPTRADR